MGKIIVIVCGISAARIFNPIGLPRVKVGLTMDVLSSYRLKFLEVNMILVHKYKRLALLIKIIAFLNENNKIIDDI